MTAAQIEARVAVLEVEMAELKTRLRPEIHPRSAWWDRIVGAFADDEAFDEAVRYGAEYRQAQRQPEQE